MSIVHMNCRMAYGVTRMVVLIGKYALKFPSVFEWRCFLLGLLANMQEAKFAQTGWPELCPVVFSLPGGFLVVMRRAEPLRLSEWKAFEQEIDAFCDKDYYTIPVERKQDSFGRIGDSIVAVDYGN